MWFARAALLVACAVAAGCGPPKRTAADGSVIRIIREVEIRGNDELSDERVEGGLATREPHGWIRRRYSELDSFDLERDRARIEAYYRRHGFFRARVTAVRVKEIGARRADVVFVVEEGPAGKVRDIEIDGALDREGLRRADLLRVSRLRAGRRFNYEDFQDSKWRIKDTLIGAGYAHAKVTGVAEVDNATLAVHIHLEVDAGPRNVFGKTTVTGTRLVPESSVRARLAWEPGEPFDARKLAETRRRILSLGRFTTVRLDLEGPRERAATDVKITVTEAPRNELRLGGGFGLDNLNYLVRGRAGYKRHGVFDPLNTLSIDLRPAYAILRSGPDANGDFVGEATATLTREDLWVPRLRGNASVAYTQQEFEAYSSLGTRLGFGLIRGFLSERLRVAAGWRYLVLRLRLVQALDQNADTVTRLSAGSPYTLGYFEQIVAYDARDNPIDARRGVYAEARLEQAGPYSGSVDASFVKITPELRGYLPLGTERLILAGRARLGRTLSGTVPLTQRYFAGGASSQRGFAQRRLSPVVTYAPAPDGMPGMIGCVQGMDGCDSAAIGGDNLFETNLEARVDVWRLAGEWLGVVFFADGADAVDEAEVDLANLHWAAGFGLRYNTVVGPVRFDLGFRLNRRDELSSDGYAFHLSLGEAF